MFTKPKPKKEVLKQKSQADDSLKKNDKRRSAKIGPRSLLMTNDHRFKKGFKKGRRRVVVLNVTDTGKMTVSKIHSLDGKEDKVEQGKLCPLEDKYKCLPKKSGVSVYPIKVDRDGKPLRVNDKEFKDLKEKMTSSDLIRVRKAREKFFGKNKKRK